PGIGKSQLTCAITAAVTTGSSWPDGSPCPMGSVVMANAEDDPAAVMKPRLMVAGSNLNNVLFVEEEEESFSIPDSLSGLEETLRRLRVPPKLMVIDPAEAFFSRWVQAKDNQTIRRAMKPLGLMAARLSMAVILVQHMPKDQTKPAIYRFSGSIGLVGAARAGFLVTRQGNLSLFSLAKSNWGEQPETLAYQIDSASYQTDDGRDIATSRIRWRMPPLDVSADDILLGAEESPADVRD